MTSTVWVVVAVEMPRRASARTSNAVPLKPPLGNA
jgi:hypothetical protein